MIYWVDERILGLKNEKINVELSLKNEKMKGLLGIYFEK